MSDLAALQEETAELRLERERADERAAAVRDVIQTIAQSRFDLDAVLQTVIDRAVSLCDADTGNIARREGDKDEYRVAAFTAMSPEYEHVVRARVYTPERGSIIGRTVLEQRVVHIEDVLEDKEYALPDLQKVAGFRTALGVPMLREGVPIGAIAVARTRSGPSATPRSGWSRRSPTTSSSRSKTSGFFRPSSGSEPNWRASRRRRRTCFRATKENSS